mgnify:CR=1 FL=1
MAASSTLRRSFKIGDPCPDCGKPLERRAKAFYWRGEFFDGAVCYADVHKHGGAIGAMWSITGEEMPPLRPKHKPAELEP